jgi:uncharacterized protein (TIGR03085 family)
MTTLARRERAALCDTFDRVGPHAPTLCGSWTTQDLAAHLVVRERHPSAIGIAVPAASDWLARAQREVAGNPFNQLVRQIRSGPPWWSPLGLPGIDPAANTLEFFVHHEDVRRAIGPWEERSFPAGELVQLWHLMRKRAPLFLRRSSFSLTIVWPGHEEFGVKPGAPDAVKPEVTLSGEPPELALYLHGRQSHATVEISGAPDEVTAFQQLDLAL